MICYDFIAWSLACLYLLLSVAFIFSSILERQRRAAVLGMFLLLPAGIVFLVILINLQMLRSTVLGVGIGGFVMVTALFFAPLGRKGALRITGEQQRVDERDIIFARAKYGEGSEAYREYYSRHPELKDDDDALRDLPDLFKQGSDLYHELDSPIPDACFDFLGDIRATSEGPSSGQRVAVDPGVMSRRLKGLARYYGAVDAGIAPLEQTHIYTHIGRGQGVYGERIDLTHPFALVFTVEMDSFMVRQAPQMPTLFESAHQYVRAAMIALPIAYYLRSLGYSARAHIDGDYRIIVPPVAVAAGLGEIGRIGLLMTPALGPRVRLGAVTTDIPLDPDQPISFGAIDFCENCRKCADNCPAGAISHGTRKDVRGVGKWSVHQEACYAYWRKTGTDCAICVTVCPYSKETTLFHNVIRLATKQSTIARRASKWADDLFYGRKPRSNRKRPWMIP